MKGIGFSEVDVRLSPLAQAVSDLYGTTDPDMIPEPEISKIFEKAKEYTQEAAKIHPVFSEATLGMVYIVATR